MRNAFRHQNQGFQTLLFPSPIVYMGSGREWHLLESARASTGSFSGHSRFQEARRGCA